MSYLKIPNKYLEYIISLNLNGSELSCLLFIYRKTIGWNKESDRIALRQFQSELNLSRRVVMNSLRSLKSKNLIDTKSKQRTLGSFSVKNLVRFSTPDKQNLVHKITPTGAENYTNLERVTLKSEHTIDNNTKETITKESPPQDSFLILWKSKFKEATGYEYSFSGKDYKILERIAFRGNLEVFEEKINELLDKCTNQSSWFTKEGIRNFQLWVLDRFWNDLISETQANRAEYLRLYEKKEKERIEREEAIKRGEY